MKEIKIDTALDALTAIALEAEGASPGGILYLVRGIAERGMVCEKVRLAQERHARASALTPAQEHAEELVSMLRRAGGLLEANSRASDMVDEIDALLDKIAPPKAPTYEESLALLRKIHDTTPCGHKPEIAALLDRARRANVMPSEREA